MPRRRSLETEPSIQSTKPIVLVIGDSFVDENWLASPRDVYHAYNVGEDHYVSNVPGADVRILSLCGAASVWRVLNGKPLPSKLDAPPALRDTFDLVGLSAWNPLDHDALLCLLCSAGVERKWANPYILSGFAGHGEFNPCPYIEGTCTARPRFCNLVCDTVEARKHTSTNRLIRVYAGFGGDQPSLKHRYDWRLPLEPSTTLTKPPSEVLGEITTITSGRPINAIVVVDHGYGVMDERLVNAIHTAHPRAKWYVRCKLDPPQWLVRLCRQPSARVRLLFRDEQLLRHRYGVRTWRHGSKVIGRGALEALGDLLGLVTYRDTKPVHPFSDNPWALRSDVAALLLDDDSALVAARYLGTHQDDGSDAAVASVDRCPGTAPDIRVGRSTVFFTSLVYWDLMNQAGVDELSESSISAAAKFATDNAYDWTKACTAAWRAQRPTELSGPYDTAIYSRALPVVSAGDVAGLSGYDTAWREWNESSRNLGILRCPGPDSGAENVPNRAELQIWRAQGLVGDYICPGGAKRDQINKLVRRLEDYGAVRSRVHPFNCLLLAEPGWGKSYLAWSLSKHFKFDYVSFSIASMASSRDLMDTLRAISSRQNEVDRQLLIFVDEIDAGIQGHSALGLLLGPMWDGTFKSEGIVYRIRPCIWVFASTKPTSRLLEESKGRDFLARINGPIIELDSFCGNDREILHKCANEPERLEWMKKIILSEGGSARTEVVYQGVNCLNRLFPPISKVDESVLKIFYNLLPINGVRSLDIFASRFTDICGGRVSVTNVPEIASYPELERHICKIETWPAVDTGREVEIIVNPPS